MAAKNSSIRIPISASATIEILVDDKTLPYCAFLVMSDNGQTTNIYPLHIHPVIISTIFNFLMLKGVVSAQAMFNVAWASRKDTRNIPIMEIVFDSPRHTADRLHVTRKPRPAFVFAGYQASYPTPFSYGVNLL